MKDKSMVVGRGEEDWWLRGWRVFLLGNLVGNNINFEIIVNIRIC